MSAELQTIISLLHEIDKANPVDVLTSVTFYSDGSGYLGQDDNRILEFDDTDQCENQLRKLLKTIKGVKL